MQLDIFVYLKLYLFVFPLLVAKILKKCHNISNSKYPDAIHDTVIHIHERSEVNDEMARDEASHGKAFEGLLKRYFG